MFDRVMADILVEHDQFFICDGRERPGTRRIGGVAQVTADQPELRVARRREHQPFKGCGEGLHEWQYRVWAGLWHKIEYRLRQHTAPEVLSPDEFKFEAVNASRTRFVELRVGAVRGVVPVQPIVDVVGATEISAKADARAASRAISDVPRRGRLAAGGDAIG